MEQDRAPVETTAPPGSVVEKRPARLRSVFSANRGSNAPEVFFRFEARGSEIGVTSPINKLPVLNPARLLHLQAAV